MLEYIEIGYLGLFLASFLAATILPFSSEGLVVAMLIGPFDALLTVVVASVGNTIGGMTSYFLGYLGKWQWLEKWFGWRSEKLGKWKSYLDKWGCCLALLCWLPIVGDSLAVVLGFARSRAVHVLVFMWVGKFSRYAVVAWITLAGVEAF